MSDENAGVGRPLTFGEKAVGLTFNPSNDPLVQGIKEQCAAMIDSLKGQMSALDMGSVGSADKMRMYSIAITDIQSAQMWAVKAITWGF